jgi:hypothetical protein
MIELSREARELIENAAHADEPTADDRRRMRQRLAVQLGAAAVATTSAVAASTAVSASAGSAASGSLVGASKGGFLAGLGKLALAASVVGAVSTAVLMNARTPATTTKPAQQQQATPAVPEPAAPVVVASAELAAVVIPSEAASQGTPVKKPKPARAGARPEAEASSLTVELELLARAQQALRQGEAKQALELAREHAARFPNGGLRQERMGVEALARCALGHDGSQVVDELTGLSPDSPLLGRVRAACGVK